MNYKVPLSEFKLDDVLDTLQIILISVVAAPFLLLAAILFLIKKELILYPLEKIAENYF